MSYFIRYASCILVFALLLGACKKNDSPVAASKVQLPDSSTVPAPERRIPGSYTANGITYGIYSQSRGGCAPLYEVFSVAAYGWDEPARYLRISFSEPPAAGKSYRVGYSKYPGTWPPTDEVYIEAGQVNTQDIFASSGNDGVMATVSLQNGKRVITIPEFAAHIRYDQGKPGIRISVQGVMLEK